MNTTRNEAVERLMNAVLQLENTDECYRFFEDLCTIKELQDMSQRFKVAEMLNNSMNYQEISGKTGASAATISRVNRCLSYGNGGYKNIITKLNQSENNNEN